MKIILIILIMGVIFFGFLSYFYPEEMQKVFWKQKYLESKRIECYNNCYQRFDSWSFQYGECSKMVNIYQQEKISNNDYERLKILRLRCDNETSYGSTYCNNKCEVR